MEKRAIATVMALDGEKEIEVYYNGGGNLRPLYGYYRQ